MFVRRLVPHRRHRHDRRRRLRHDRRPHQRARHHRRLQRRRRARSRTRCAGSTASPTSPSSACRARATAKRSSRPSSPQPGETVDVEALRAYARETLAAYKVPQAGVLRRRAAEVADRQGAAQEGARRAGRRRRDGEGVAGMRFGIFIPQGWRHDLVGIEPAEQWRVMSDLAQHADAGPWESIWVYDHFHTVPVPTEEATHEAWTLMSAFAATTSRIRHRPDVHLHELPQPGLPGQGRGDRRHHLGRPHRDGHRRRLVRARVARLRIRVPRPPENGSDAARGRRDHEAGLDHRHRDPRRASTTRWTARSCGRCRCRRAASRSGSPEAARR